MKAYAKIFSVALAIHLSPVAVEQSLGGENNIDLVIARGFTATSNTGSLFSRAVTATSNTDSLFSRAFTAVNCEEDAGGLCADCDSDGIADQCEIDCGTDDGPCDVEGCGGSDDCDLNRIPDECDGVRCIRDTRWLCDGDTDGDGQVNPVDSGLVQAAFGSTDEDDLCQYDLDCDGQINPVDSGIVQALFGTCEAARCACE